MTDTMVIRDAVAPAEWTAALRTIDPIRASTSYLDFVWYGPGQRWVLYEFVPAFTVPPEVLHELRSLDAPPVRYGVLNDRLISGLQWELFQSTGRFALPCWVLQGSKGGHLVTYDRMTARACQMAGLPTSPPGVGDLPACPFDNRVTRQILKMNKLHEARNDIDAFVRGNTKDALAKKEQQRMAQFRAEMLAWLQDQAEEPAEHFLRAMRTGEADVLPVSGTDWKQKEEQASETYVTTGAVT
jgi:hypothetical protein